MSELLRADDKPRPVPHERAIVLEQRKLIVGPHGELEQYDLNRDPAESMRAERVDPDLRGGARVVQGARRACCRVGPAPTLPPELGERLKALGYVQ